MIARPLEMWERADDKLRTYFVWPNLHSFIGRAVIPGENLCRPDLDRGKEEARKKAQKVHKEKVCKLI